jgi:glucose 1-dehydrogenase
MGGDTHFAVEGDVSSEDAVVTMMGTVIERFGRLDILVNNAGIQDTTPGDSFDLSTVNKILGVN